MNLFLLPSWQENTNPKKDQDPSLALAKLFLRANDQVSLVMADYLPKFRTWLGQAGLEDVEYWSVFDDLQQITLVDQQPLALEDFSWPAKAQFLRMYDRIVVLLDNSHYATVYFTYPQANLIDRIDLLVGGQVNQQLTIDDRGFISRVLTYQDQEVQTIDYLNQSGFVVGHEDVQTGRFQVQLANGRQAEFASRTDFIVNTISQHLQKIGQGEGLLVSPTGVNLQIAEQVTDQYQLRVLDYPFDERKMTTTVDVARLKTLPRVIGQLSGDDLGQTENDAILLAPLALDLTQALARPKSHFVCYWRLGELPSSVSNQIFAKLFDWALNHENFVLIIENDMWQSDFQQELTRHLEQVGQSQTMTPDRLAALPSQFVFLDWQGFEKRQEYLQTAAVVMDLADDIDLGLQAQALAHALPALTKVQTAYQSADFVLVKTAEDVLDRLALLAEKDFWREAQADLGQQRERYADESLVETWHQVLSKD